jgi:hypothetical protein
LHDRSTETIGREILLEKKRKRDEMWRSEKGNLPGLWESEAARW